MVMIPESDLKTSLGALIIGGMVCTGLSGVVAMQTVLYFRLFTRDKFSTKFQVHFLHSVMIAAANYMYFVDNFGNTEITDRVFWFFALRLFKLSKGNYWVTVPIVILAVARVGAIHLGSFHEFGERFRWVFTLGLVLSSVVDFLITGGLCYYLRRNRTGTGRFDHVLDSVTLYTVENGLLTSVTTLVSLIFWLVRPHVLIYLGLHFAISKLYANSFLASMNARKILRAQSESHSGGGSAHRLPVIFASRAMRHSNADQLNLGTRVQITVDKTVDYATDDVPDSLSVTTDLKNRATPSV
ncbi:uncharacterized protein TRAVEDRAFT_33992 [Trametes versicolor FP-101664 SS1]|uniref:uncharacterized protein n=1 Tax=Trametes versicolor (strain FP-101664) TaxID=717944 RepID=UPI0004624629|nr:uncharacterized protein TRAVEDRAFT_33992 [Trametes versicolor FP-101664 SS1]EIW62566.1 hypothetical protein TRAVEDRAFT_33992 [Trametes versicolor FP-101664 SS1]